MGATCSQCSTEELEIKTEKVEEVKEKEPAPIEVSESKPNEQEEEHVNETPTQDVDPIQLASYDMQDNGPLLEYAQKISVEEEAEVYRNLPPIVKSLQAKHKKVILKVQVSPNYRKIPVIDEAFRLTDGNIYIGQWANRRPFGIGTIYFTDKSVYEGQVEEGLPCGEGRKIFPDGAMFHGQFKYGEIIGVGKLTKPDGFSYKGQLLNGKPDGNGMEQWPNGTTYQGQYSLGKKCGRGTFTWAAKMNKKTGLQENYVGDFLNDLFHGYGKYEWQDGRIYEGEWFEGKMEGHGEFTWPDKRRYIGNYIQDYKAGEGTLEWPDGKRLNGFWKMGKLHGIATLFLKGKENQPDKEYKGEWEDGKRLRWLCEQAPSIIQSNVSFREERERQEEIINSQIN